MEQDFFTMRNIVKQYPVGDEVMTVLKGIDLTIDRGEYLSVLGPSGSGKSTLMNIIVVWTSPPPGSIFSMDREWATWMNRNWPGFAAGRLGLSFRIPRCCPCWMPRKMWNCP